MMITHSADILNAHFYLLAEKIKSQWEAGVTADDSVSDYIASTFSDPTIDRLKQVISSRSNATRDSLIDLLLYPDEAFQVSLEPLIQNQPFSKTDEQKVIDWLTHRRISIMIYLPALEGKVTVDPSRPELERAINRLNLDWQVPQALSQAINRYIDENRQALVRVRLRNAGLKMNDATLRFLCDFIQTFPDLTDRYADYFHFTVNLISTLPNKPFFDVLMDEKRRLMRGLRQSVQFETVWPKANMETLMLKGIHAPAGSAAFYRSHIAIIDDMVWAMYGKQES